MACRTALALLVSALVAVSLVASCTGSKQPLAVRPTSAPKVQTVALAGTVKLLAAPAISDNGAGAISDNGAGIISNNSGALISDHGTGLTGKTKRTVLQAAPREFLLADATITFTDAAGKAVTDAAGKPVQAVTDGKGAYTLAAALPAKNLVLHVKLHEGGALHGGELTALLPRDNGATRGIDTASSLGASYVLGTFVHGDQGTLDKLPAAATAKLDAAIATALAGTTTAPTYQAADLLQQADVLRGKAPAVASAIEDIKALLVGQAALGAGRKATEVALSTPSALVVDGAGNLLVCEETIGRIRTIAPDGTIGTFADPVRGKLRRNFLDTLDLARGADGALYLASYGLVVRIAPDGTVTNFAGNAERAQGAVDVPATSTAVAPHRVAVAPDGTVYIGEEGGRQDIPKARLLAVGPDGRLRKLPVGDGFDEGNVEGLDVAADGTLFVVFRSTDHPGVLTKIVPGQAPVTLASDLPPSGDLVVGADGTLYYSDRSANTVWAWKDGKRTSLIDVTAGIHAESLALAADGRLFVSDYDNGLVYRLAEGGPELIGGATLASQSHADLRDVALNRPVGAAFGPQGNLLMTEGGSRSIVRFDGHTLTRLTAGGKGDAGDGGPLSGAVFSNPSGLAVHGQDIYVVDGEAGRLRKIGADGVITTVVGPNAGHGGGLEKGERLPAAQYKIGDGGLAVDPAGRPYFTRNFTAQVLRLAADGQVEAVAGAAPSIWTDAMVNDAATLLADVFKEGAPAADAHLFRPLGLAFDSKGALYVADLQAMRVCKVTGLDGPSPTISTFAGVGPARTVANADGLVPGKQEGIKATDATLVLPFGVAVDAQDNVYVTEIGSVSVPATYQGTLGSGLAGLPQVPARVRKITPEGIITTIAGPGSKRFPDPAAEDGLALPTGLAVAPDGRLAIVDPGANLIHLLPAGSY
jgi:sugar lactone lactonase YvrE